MRCLSLLSFFASTGAGILTGLLPAVAVAFLPVVASANLETELPQDDSTEPRAQIAESSTRIVCDVVGVTGDADQIAGELGFALNRVVFTGDSLCFFEGEVAGAGGAAVAQTVSALTMYRSEGGRTFAWLNEDTFLYLADGGENAQGARPARLVVLEDYEFQLMCRVSADTLLD